MSSVFLLLPLGVLTVGAIFCVMGRGPGVSRLGAAVSAAGAIFAIAPAVFVLVSGQTLVLRHPWAVPFGSFYLAVDALTAFFMIVVAVVCALAAVYGTGYLDSYSGRKHLGVSGCFFNLLFASMLLIVMARNGVLFIMAWEAMSLTSFFLVMFEHETASVQDAGWTYLTAAHLGAACLMALFVLMAGHHMDLDFDHLAAAPTPVLSGVMFILAVLGFGAKAGFVPMHVWLPEAHPAAPSHVSAVMSAVMIKTGIYGLVRIVSIIGPPAPWWGWTLLIIGAASGIFGVLSALAQHDLKRLLAYHSVENIGIICLGLGLWLLGAATGHPVLAALGLMGGLLHVCNHAIFKSLLFLGAGAVKHATHTLEIDRLGGLQKHMPKTALSMLIGAAAICGLPPLNGFVSEFLIYLAAYGALAHASVLGGAAAGGLVTLLALGLIGGLAAACFTKMVGIVFLGAPRSQLPQDTCEAPRCMRQPMAVLSILCILLGIGAPLGIAFVSPAAGQLLGTPETTEAVSSALPLLFHISLGAGLLIGFSVLLIVFRRYLLSGRTVGRDQTWGCGYSAPNSRMQYTASSFAWPILWMFRWFIGPRLHVQMDKEDFPRQAQLTSHTDDFFRQRLFAPVFRFVQTLARRLHGLQQGRNQLYVLYIAVAVLALLLLEVR